VWVGEHRLGVHPTTLTVWAVIAGLVQRPELQVRRIDIAIGQLQTPFGRLRRRLLFASANQGSDRGEQPPQASAADAGR